MGAPWLRLRAAQADHMLVGRMIRATQCAALFVLIAALSGCGSAGGRAGYTSQQQTIDGMTILLERPQQIAILQDIEAFVTLTDASGKRVDGATVYLEQDMPTMKMSSNQ